MSVLAAAGIAAAYGAREVLRECDLALEAGEIVAVIGPNGAGKSTLVRVLAALLRPSQGEVRIAGQRLAGLSRTEVARRVAVVPQAQETLFPFSVREVVALGRTARLDLLGRLAAEDRAAVDRALALMDLDALADRRIDAVSGGERQRAVLAMALAQETPVLLLDEPTVHLDPGHQLATLGLLRRLARERGTAVLAVVHDLNLAALADRVAVLDGGTVRAAGTPASVLTAELVAAVFGPGWRVTLDGGIPLVAPAR